MNLFVFMYLGIYFATDQHSFGAEEAPAAWLTTLLLRLPGACSGVQRRILEMIFWENQPSGTMGGTMGEATPTVHNSAGFQVSDDHWETIGERR